MNCESRRLCCASNGTVPRLRYQRTRLARTQESGARTRHTLPCCAFRAIVDFVRTLLSCCPQLQVGWRTAFEDHEMLRAQEMLQAGEVIDEACISALKPAAWGHEAERLFWALNDAPNVNFTQNLLRRILVMVGEVRVCGCA